MNKTKISLWVNYAEIVGVVAIVISLAVVVFELRENSKATNAASAIAHSTNMSDWYARMASDEKAIANFLKFVDDPESCTQKERASAVFSLHSMMIVLQNGFYLSRQGVFDADYETQLSTVLTTISDSKGYRFYWELRKGYFDPEWRAVVDSILLEDHSDRQTIYRLPAASEGTGLNASD